MNSQKVPAGLSGANNLTRKILAGHLVEGELVAGSPVAIRIDQTLTQDATGTMACLQFEALGAPRVRTELSVSYVDHNTIQIGYENADDHRYLQAVAARFGMHFSRPGNGICHQVHLERFGVPGKTLLGADSHTPTGGGIGMIAIGAGGLDVAVAMGGGPFHLACPAVTGIELSGALRRGVSAKDVILAVLKILTTRGNVGTCLEYFGPGVGSLTVPERATIANMGAEAGVTFSIFPSDGRTRDFLSAQGRKSSWRELSADPGAPYDAVIRLDLSCVEPLVAAPHGPDQVVPVRERVGTKVHQVCIGSCTNSSVRDLETAAALLAGRTVHPDVSLVIAPGSRQALAMIAESGALSRLILSGARLIEPSCAFCIGNCQSPGTGQVSVRTINRNFKGRSGTPDAQVYLASVETAALCALRGEFADPREVDPAVYDAIPPVPVRFLVDDRMIVPPLPPAQAEKVSIPRGPNIGPPPAGEPLPDRFEARVALALGDDVTTDHIMPAGARLKFRSNIPRYADCLFEGVDPGFVARAKENQAAGRANVIVAGASYGQGSSREHAAICPRHVGVRAVLARSIERIHAANLVNFGILPLLFVDPADRSAFEPGDDLVFPDLHAAVGSAETLTVENRTKGRKIALELRLDARQRRILRAGGLLDDTMRRAREGA